jgi:hypothetical protein
MHRLSADRTGRPHIDREMSYRNSGIPKPKVDAGSGATPTIPPGSLVAITDNADPMDADVYRTATRLRHHQHRVVCQVPVFAKSASASENSLISPSRSLSVENNYGYQDPFGPTQVRSHSQASRGWTSTSTSTAAGWCGQTTPRAPPAWVPKLSTTTSPGPRARGFRIWREAVTASAPRRQSGVAAPGQSGQRGSRAARALWSGSGGRGGVGDLGGGGQLTAEASAASRSGSRSARTRNVAFALAGPAMPDGTKAIDGYPRPHARSVCPASLRAAWRCASFRLVARRWPVLRNRGGRPAVRGSRPPRAMIARGRAGAPGRVRAIADARRASGQARP